MQFLDRKMRVAFGLFWALFWFALSNAPAIGAPVERGRDTAGTDFRTGKISPKATSGAKYVTIDFDDVDLTVFIKYISELTGKNFVIDKAVQGNVTIISPTKISEEDAYQVFESVLEVQGFTTVPAGSIIKIVPAVQARSKSVETGLIKEFGVSADKVVTQLIPLRYASPEELKKLFAPLVSKTSVVISYTPTGMLIVTDVLSNIKRLLQIIKEIDVPALGEEISVLPLQYASANEVSKSLTTLFQQATRIPQVRGATQRTTVVAAGGTEVKIIPDERINALIILASEDDTERIRQLLELLDREIPRGEGDIHVYYLQNADAEDLTKVLTTLPTENAGKGEKGKAPVLSKEVQIVADKATNALVITAKKTDYQIMEDVIKKLDIPRRMVYLEALIMEVNVEKDFSLGVEWRGGFTYDNDTSAAFGGSRRLGTDSLFSPLLATPPTLPQGLSLGVLGRTITIGGQEFSSIGAILQAYKNDADVHIVSTPQILTTDNQEAEIKVGENVPYITSRNTTAANQDYTNFEYKDVSTTLKITPQINQEGVVRLRIFTEIIKLKNPDVVTDTPTTLKRTADTAVIVQDQNTVVIGGIIGDDTKEDTYKVPLLGDIPLLGWLFKSQTTTQERTNLYIFLTPRIVRNPAEAAKIYQQKKQDSDWRHKKGFDEPFQQSTNEPDPAKLSALGFQHLQAKEFSKAKVYYEKVLVSNPNDPVALINMGVIYEAEGDKALASMMYEKVISLNPSARAAVSTDPNKEGQTLVEIARDNLEKLKTE